MSKTDSMAKLTGLHQRGGVYQLRVVIPLDLRTAYNGRTKVIRSLATTDKRTAALNGAKRRAEVLQEFEDLRRALNPQAVATLSPDLGRILGDRIRQWLLEGNASLRDDGALLSELASVVKPGQALMIQAEKSPAPRASSLDGLSDDQLAALTGLNAAVDGQAAVQLAGLRLSVVLPLADAEARKLGMLIDWHTPEARPVLLQCLQAYRQARADITKIDAGQQVEMARPPHAASAQGKALTLRQVFERWKPTSQRKRGSNRACELALELFEGQYGDMPVDQITRNQGDAFRVWLQQQPGSSKSASDRFTWIKTLLLYASRDLELIPRNPWDRLAIASRTESKRRPWTADELQAFFSLPIFTEYAVPQRTDAGADAAYWIPLLGLYSGATVSELAQMRVQDVMPEGSFPTFRITDEGEGMSAKNAYRVREIPVHSELIRLGFLEYAKAIKDRGEGSLWPALKLRKDKPGGYFSEWFGKVRKAPPLNFGKAPDFHCFRHTVRSAMTEAGFENSIKDRITGHTVKGSAGTTVYEHPKEILHRAVDSIRYAALSLPKVYKVPAAAATQK